LAGAFPLCIDVGFFLSIDLSLGVINQRNVQTLLRLMSYLRLFYQTFLVLAVVHFPHGGQLHMRVTAASF
jgi:hypothetical protein